MKWTKFTRHEIERLSVDMNLTKDEDTIFQLLTSGYSITQIADVLKMSTRTVDRRIKDIKYKLHKVGK